MNKSKIQGIAASEGIAIGPAYIYKPVELEIPDREPLSNEEEMTRFEEAKEQAHSELESLYAIVYERTGDEEHAAIFDAHMMMLDDPTFKSKVEKEIAQGQIVERAVKKATSELAAMLSEMDDELFAARAADVQDMGRRVLRILLDEPDTSLDALDKPSIIVAPDLTPSDTAGLTPDLVLGFCTAAGGLTSHTAILARTLNIPAVVGAGSALLEKLGDGAPLILDGIKGEIFLNPTDEKRGRYQEIQSQRREWLDKVQEVAHKITYTANGRRVEVGANVGDIKSARDSVKHGAEGIGLLRTEFLYLSERQPPDEEQQIKIYRTIFEVMEDKPVIVRTLDVGGDKPLSFIDFEDELNPFLGWRAIRISLSNQELFKTQLRAVLQAAEDHDVRIMYPMISGVEELRKANEVLAESQEELDAKGISYNREIPVGIMIETPSAVTLADIFAAECDFFSIGTNDLTQYTLAVDRTNERVARLYQPLHPSVLRLIKQTIEAAHKHDTWVGMCGELAGMQKAIPVLLGLGLDEFSMVPSAIPQAKWLIRQLNDEETQQIADQALQKVTAAEVEALMEQTLADYAVTP